MLIFLLFARFVQKGRDIVLAPALIYSRQVRLFCLDVGH